MVFLGSSWPRRLVLSLTLWNILCRRHHGLGVDAVLPQLALDVRGSDGAPITTFFLSHAMFGRPVEDLDKAPLTVTYPPDETNALLCQNVTTATTDDGSRTPEQLPAHSLLLVPRGECTFETKAINAQALGAAAVVIYGSLASRYSLNKTRVNETTTDGGGAVVPHHYTKRDIVYPANHYDYDCANGQAWIPAEEILLDSPLPYNPASNDPVLSGPESVCHGNASPEFVSSDGSRPARCDSHACLLTGNTSQTGLKLQACCAWDLHIWLYPDTSLAVPPVVTIPAAYMTAGQLRELSTILTSSEQRLSGSLSNSAAVTVVLYPRWRPSYNLSAILIWALGTVIAALAAHLSASDYHDQIRRVRRRLARRAERASTTRPATTPQSPRHRHPQPPLPEEVLELTAAHAAGFVVTASTSLLVLFYFKIYGIVKIFYAFGCSTAVAQVILHPLSGWVYRTLRWRDVTVWRTGTEDFGDIGQRDIVVHAVGYTLGAVWLYMAFFVRDADAKAFFWILQDVFGACMCVTFLKVIRLNSIHVASTLLVVAFFYDIFFVFVTPYLFHGKSVMITVATSGGPPTADALWCEKYPDDVDCQGGNPLPMLLAIPKLFDFAGGSSLLGLGDIVLPGLLLSFAARLDAAKKLLGVMGGGRGANRSYNCPEQKCCGGFSSCLGSLLCQGGYFVPLVVSYAIGLAMANTAVYLMNMGQPALLYLVPCCLGTMVYIGWRRGELTQLYEGPRILRAADDIVFGECSPPQGTEHAVLPSEEGQDDEDVILAPPSAVDDEADELINPI